MKNHANCPKCGADNIIRIDGYCGAYGTGNNIRTGYTMFNAVPVNRYLCCNCGYTEEWIDKDDINKLEQKYK